MSQNFEKTMDLLDCPHIDCSYYQVVTEISGTHVKNKLTLQKECMNCTGKDHLMFDVGSYKAHIDSASVGDRFEVKETTKVTRSKLPRSSQGDILTVTAIATNPLSNNKTIVSVARNLSKDAPYRTGIINADRFESLISKDSLEIIR